MGEGGFGALGDILKDDFAEEIVIDRDEAYRKTREAARKAGSASVQQEKRERPRKSKRAKANKPLVTENIERPYKRQVGRPRSNRTEALSLKTTVEHLSVLFSLRDTGAVQLTDVLEDALAALAEKVVSDGEYRNVSVDDNGQKTLRQIISR